AVQLERLMSRGRPFAKSFRRLPFLIPIPWQCTSLQPAKDIYAQLAATEGGAISSTSFLMGFPAADFEECAPAVLAYGETQAAPAAPADSMCELLLSRERDVAGRAHEPDEGVRKAMRIARSANRPVIIADTQDTPGAGGNSDTTGMLRALVRNGAERAAIGIMVDPEAALVAHRTGEGAEISIALGGKSGIEGDAPFEGTFRVERLSNGDLHATGPYYGGTHLNLGPSACLTIGGVKVVVATHKA